MKLKNKILSAILFVTLPIVSAHGATKPSEESLEQKMQTLNLNDRAPVVVTQEKFYSIQPRLAPLKKKSEFSVGGASNLTSDGFINSRQLEVAYRYHFNDRWGVGLARGFVSNELSSAATRLKDSQGVLPMVPYTIARTDLTAEVNLFYGKFRLSSERVFYFDQYFALGVGYVEMNNASVNALVADVGLAAWIGQSMSARLGLKDYTHDELYPSGPTRTNNVHAHLDLGILF